MMERHIHHQRIHWPGKVKDRLSSLPEHILVTILSLLPLKSAIATSALSRQWRHLWTQSTSFIVSNPYRSCTEIDLLWYDLKLKQLTSPSILTFDLSLLGFPTSFTSLIDSWFLQVRARNVRKIKVTLPRMDWKLLPCVIQTPSLVELDVYAKGLILPCVESDLPNLRKLILQEIIDTPINLLEKFVNSCSSLEELYFILHVTAAESDSDVSFSARNLKRLGMKLDSFEKEIVIDAPNLEQFIVYGPTKLRFVEVPKALLHTELRECKDDSDCQLSNFVGSLTESVRFLELDCVPFVPEGRFRFLTCLKWKLKALEFGMLMKFLEFCPALKVLGLEIFLNHGSGNWRWKKWNIWSIEQSQRYMNKIEIEIEQAGLVFRHKKHVMRMVKYLLECGCNDLKMFTFRIARYDSERRTSFSSFENNLVMCLGKFKNVSKYEIDSSTSAYWRFVALF